MCIIFLYLCNKLLGDFFICFKLSHFEKKKKDLNDREVPGFFFESVRVIII